MAKSIGWSYSPYRPPLFESGDVYINRIAPGEFHVHFEWSGNAEPYMVFFGVRGSGKYSVTENIAEKAFTVAGLPPDTDYEFFVEGMESGRKSRVRLARTGAVTGTVINYLHPDDDAYSFSGKALCSPSLVRHPDGFLLASMDVYAKDAPQNLTLIFRSDDNGENWHYVSELFPSFWGKMFIHRGELYMLSCSTEYGDLLIGRSRDGGKTWPAPTVLMRGSCSPKYPGVHKNPQPVVSYCGRLWNTLEWGCWASGFHAPMVMSCDENADLLNADSWVIAPPLPYDSSWPGTADGPSSGNIEGTLVAAPDGKLYNIMRYDTTRTKPSYGLALMYEVNTACPAAPLKFSRAVCFDGNLSKFSIKKDPLSGIYYTLYNRITDPSVIGDRRLLVLARSVDLEHWTAAANIIDRRGSSPKEEGFQYVDFEIEGDDIIFVCRTAQNGARNFHDANYSTFHRICNFRAL